MGTKYAMISYEVRLEKRILPLIDITVILVGILILLMGAPQISEHQLFVLQISGREVVYNDLIISSGSEIVEETTRDVLTRAITGGFNRIEIRPPSQRPYALSAREISSIEQQLQRVALQIVDELQLRSGAIVIRYQDKP